MPKMDFPVFDCHAHLPFEPLPKEYRPRDYLCLRDGTPFFVEELTSFLKLLNPVNRRTFPAKIVKRFSVPDAKSFAGLFAQRGIRKAVVSSFAASAAKKASTLKAGNRRTSELCRKYPSRFFGGCVVNPAFAENSHEEIDRYLRDGDFVYLGEVCPYLQRFDADSKAFGPFAERAAELDVPVLVRTLNTPQQEKLLRCANMHRKTRFIMSNMGGGRNFGVPHICHKASNVFLDFSGVYAAYSLGQLDKALEAFGEDRVLWGSDFPSVEPACTMAIVLHSKIPSRVKEKILWKNTKAVVSRLQRGKP